MIRSAHVPYHEFIIQSFRTKQKHAFPARRLPWPLSSTCRGQGAAYVLRHSRHLFDKKKSRNVLPRASTRPLFLVTHFRSLAGRREATVLKQGLPDERALRHELVGTDERVERPRRMLGPDVDNVDVDHAGVQIVERCLEGLHRHGSKSRCGGRGCFDSR